MESEASSPQTPGLTPDELLDLMPAAVITVDRAMAIRYANPSACRLLCSTPGELLGRPLDEAAGENGLIFHQLVQEALENGQPAEPRERLLLTESGETRNVQVTGVRKGDCVTCFITDLSRVRQGQRQREKAARTLILERLASGVAHELDQALEYLRGSMSTGGSGSVEDRVRAVHCLQSLRRSLLGMAGVEGEAADLVEVVQRALTRSRESGGEAHRRCRLAYKGSEKPYRISVEASEAVVVLEALLEILCGDLADGEILNLKVSAEPGASPPRALFHAGFRRGGESFSVSGPQVASVRALLEGCGGEMEIVEVDCGMVSVKLFFPAAR